MDTQPSVFSWIIKETIYYQKDSNHNRIPSYCMCYEDLETGEVQWQHFRYPVSKEGVLLDLEAFKTVEECLTHIFYRMADDTHQVSRIFLETITAEGRYWWTDLKEIFNEVFLEHTTTKGFRKDFYEKHRDYLSTLPR